jgi:plastocyanin
MRVALLVVGLLVLRASAAGTPAADLRGTARAGDRPQPNAVVWLEAPNAPPGSEVKRPVLDQRNLTFSPHVLAVRVGAAVDFPNNDRVFHNVFSFRDGKKFDLGLYPVGVQKPVVFDKRPGSVESSAIFTRTWPPTCSPSTARTSGSRTIAERLPFRWSPRGASRITRGVLAGRT